MEKLKIIFFGTPDFVIPVIDALNSNFDLKAIVTAPDAIVGRKQLLTESAASVHGTKLKIPVLKPQKLTPEFIDENKELLSADLYVVASYGYLIPESLLNIPKYGSLNIHPSKLPKFRGPSPIQNTILAGEKETAITIIKMDSELDHGPIVAQVDFPLKSSDTFASLLISMFDSSAKLIVQIIPDYVSGKITPINQQHSEATFTEHITKENGYFDIEIPPTKEKLDRMIRAYYPWPTAWTKWQGKIVKFLPEGKIQMEGKSPVSIKDFLNGYSNFPKTIL